MILNIVKLYSSNGICEEGAAKLGEAVSKLMNLVILNLNFR
jgi:hypothetical protein